MNTYVFVSEEREVRIVIRAESIDAAESILCERMEVAEAQGIDLPPYPAFRLDSAY